MFPSKNPVGLGADIAKVWSHALYKTGHGFTSFPEVGRAGYPLAIVARRTDVRRRKVPST